jgi:hypothetical protein
MSRIRNTVAKITSPDRLRLRYPLIMFIKKGNLRNDSVPAEDAVALVAAATGVDDCSLGLHPDGPATAHQ